MDQLNVRAQILPIHWEAGVGLLSVKSLLQDAQGMASMDANRVAGDVSGWKKGEPHEVIPVHMGHEKIIHLGFAWAVLAHDLLPKTPQPRAHITHHVLGATHDVHTRGVATVAVPDRKIEFLINKALDSRVVVKASAIGLQECLLNFATHPGPGQGDRNGATSSPKTYEHSSSGQSHEEGASWALERQQRGQAQDILGTLAMIGSVIHERADERNPQATYRTLGSVHREVWSWSGEHIEGDARINELNRKVSHLILHAAHFHLAAAIRIGVEANIRQGLFDGEFDLYDTLGEKAC